MVTDDEALRALRKLLVSLFSLPGLRIFLADLAGSAFIDSLPGSTALEEFAFDTIRALQRSGLIDNALFAALLSEFPRRRGDIAQVAAQCGCSGAIVGLGVLELAHATLVIAGDTPAFVRRMTTPTVFGHVFRAHDPWVSYRLVEASPQNGHFCVALVSRQPVSSPRDCFEPTSWGDVSSVAQSHYKLCPVATDLEDLAQLVLSWPHKQPEQLRSIAEAYFLPEARPTPRDQVQVFAGNRASLDERTRATWDHAKALLNPHRVHLGTLQSFVEQLARRALGSLRKIPRGAPILDFIGPLDETADDEGDVFPWH